MIIFSRKSHSCWGNPPFKDTSILKDETKKRGSFFFVGGFLGADDANDSWFSFKGFLECSPWQVGKMNPFWASIFSDGVGNNRQLGCPGIMLWRKELPAQNGKIFAPPKHGYLISSDDFLFNSVILRWTMWIFRDWPCRHFSAIDQQNAWNRGSWHANPPWR